MQKFLLFFRKWHTKKSQKLASYFNSIPILPSSRPANCFAHTPRVHCHLCSLFLLLHLFTTTTRSFALPPPPLLLPFSSLPPGFGRQGREKLAERGGQSKAASASCWRGREQQNRERENKRAPKGEREHTQTRTSPSFLSPPPPLFLSSAHKHSVRSPLPLSSSLPLPPPCPSSQLPLYLASQYSYLATSSRPSVLANPSSCVLLEAKD